MKLVSYEVRRLQTLGFPLSFREATPAQLAICKRLAESMNGSIGVESRPGEGSTFWVILRASPENAFSPSGTRGNTLYD